jgi:hypothetical protein
MISIIKDIIIFWIKGILSYVLPILLVLFIFLFLGTGGSYIGGVIDEEQYNEINCK